MEVIFFLNWSVFSVTDTYLNLLGKWKLQIVNQKHSVGGLIQNIHHAFTAYLDDLQKRKWLSSSKALPSPTSDHSPLFLGAEQGSPVPRVPSFLSPISAGTVPHISHTQLMPCPWHIPFRVTLSSSRKGRKRLSSGMKCTVNSRAVCCHPICTF